MKKHMNLTKGKISKLHKKNKQTRKKKSYHQKQKKRNHKNHYTFRKKRWIDLANKTLKKMSGGNQDEPKIEPDILNTNAKFELQEQSHEIQNQDQLEGVGAKLEMPEITPISTIHENISEEIINDLPEDILEDIVSGVSSNFKPESIPQVPSVSSTEIDIQEEKPVLESQTIELISEPELNQEPVQLQAQEPEPIKVPVQEQEQEQESGLNPRPFESVKDVSHILASSSDFPFVYGGKKRRFRLTREKNKK